MSLSTRTAERDYVSRVIIWSAGSHDGSYWRQLGSSARRARVAYSTQSWGDPRAFRRRPVAAMYVNAERLLGAITCRRRASVPAVRPSSPISTVTCSHSPYMPSLHWSIRFRSGDGRPTGTLVDPRLARRLYRRGLVITRVRRIRAGRRAACCATPSLCAGLPAARLFVHAAADAPRPPLAASLGEILARPRTCCATR